MTSHEQTSDEQTIASMTSDGVERPRHIQPAESGLIRFVVFATAPVWLLAVVALIVGRLATGGRPVLVLHERVGFGRQPLWVPKIATAAVASNQQRFRGLVEVATGPPIDLEVRNPRDQWLRTTGLDELPQLVLVLMGRMRIVGPRPITPSEIGEMLESHTEVGIDHLQPGLIGLWQVLDRHAYQLGERCDLDLVMVDNWSQQLRRRLTVIALRQAVRRLRPA